MNQHARFRTSLVLVRALTIAFVMASLATSVSAGESIKWRGLAALVVTESTPIKWMDRPDHNVGQGKMDGVIFTQVGGSFLDKARYQVLNQWDSAANPTFWGCKTFTEGDGSQLFLRYEQPREGMKPPRFLGNWMVIGGTGKYKGAKGKGTYDVTFVSDVTLWDVLEGEVELP